MGVEGLFNEIHQLKEQHQGRSEALRQAQREWQGAEESRATVALLAKECQLRLDELKQQLGELEAQHLETKRIVEAREKEHEAMTMDDKSLQCALDQLEDRIASQREKFISDMEKLHRGLPIRCFREEAAKNEEGHEEDSELELLLLVTNEAYVAEKKGQVITFEELQRLNEELRIKVEDKKNVLAGEEERVAQLEELKRKRKDVEKQNQALEAKLCSLTESIQEIEKKHQEGVLTFKVESQSIADEVRRGEEELKTLQTLRDSLLYQEKNLAMKEEKQRHSLQKVEAELERLQTLQRLKERQQNVPPVHPPSSTSTQGGRISASAMCSTKKQQLGSQVRHSQQRHHYSQQQQQAPATQLPSFSLSSTDWEELFP
ncbi:hypothetical protein QOT17_008941 [Balamuthia mandrillaris]